MGCHQAQLADKQLLPLNGVLCTLSESLTQCHKCTQAVIGCFSVHKARGSMANIQEGQLLQALEYFNLPEFMWPLGLYIRHTHCLKRDEVAKQWMTTIKADSSKMAEQNTHFAVTFTKRYGVCDCRKVCTWKPQAILALEVSCCSSSSASASL